ncbi:MAG: hypothetical protein WKF71_10965 [Pyrinomonadaceae bacterium]
MNNLTKGLIVIVAILAIGAGLVFWKTKVAGHGEELNSISAEEMQILLKDANPMELKKLADSPEQKKKIAENLEQLLAVASQARKEGFAEEPNVRRELESIRSVITATIYDEKTNKGKGQMPPSDLLPKNRSKNFGAKTRLNRPDFKQRWIILV